jgi:hypothetical protein
MASNSVSKVTLSPSFELTTEHSSSSYGQPVLVHRADRQAYGPGDVFQPYPSWPSLPASQAVARMARTKKLTDKERAFVTRFVNFAK